MRARFRHQQLVTIGVETFTVEHDYLHSAPMSSMTRSGAYRRQNCGRELTARQRRQLDRMSRRAVR